MKEDYQGRIDPTQKEWQDSKWTDLLKERYYIASLFAEGKVVLDSCCGAGFGAMNFIVPKSRFTVGIDICESAAKSYGKSEKYEFLTMDGRAINLNSEAFDLVLSLDAIEHFNKEDGINYLSGIKKVCKKDGLIVGTTPLVIDESLIPTYLEWNKFHLFMYTKGLLAKTLHKLFPFVRIYEIYSPVCPYFLFLCGRVKPRFASKNEDKIQKFIFGDRDVFRKSQKVNYLIWCKMLLHKNKLFKAGYLFLLACFIKLENSLKCR